MIVALYFSTDSFIEVCAFSGIVDALFVADGVQVLLFDHEVVEFVEERNSGPRSVHS